MVKSQPTELNGAPISMAVIELRFDSDIPFAERTTRLLQSMIGAGVGEISPANPDFNLPSKLIETNQDFYFHSLWSCNYKGLKATFGPRVLDVFSPIPYIGWERLSKVVNELLSSTLFVRPDFAVSRIGVRYVNSLPARWNECTTVKMEVSGTRLDSSIVNLKYTQNRSSQNVAVVVRGEVVDGLPNTTVDIDVTVDWAHGTKTVAEVFESIESAHQLEKDIFFNLLTDETVTELGPTYE